MQCGQKIKLKIKLNNAIPDDQIVASLGSHECNVDTLSPISSPALEITRVSLVALTVKNLPATQENQVQCLGQEEPLEKGMATHSSFLAWRIPWTEEPGRLQSM